MSHDIGDVAGRRKPRTGTGGWAGILAAALAALVIALPAEADDRAVGQAAERLFSEARDIQFELPGLSGLSNDQATGAREDGWDWRELPDGTFAEDLLHQLFGPLGPIWQALLLMVCAAVLVLLGLWLSEMVPGFGRFGRAHGGAEGPAEGPDAAHHEALDALAEADLLARQGCAAEAVHVLLVHGLTVLRDRRAGGLAASLTSREILQLSSLSPASQEALGALVARVEPIFFGGRAATLDDYRTCRGLFDDFAAALRAPA